MGEKNQGSINLISMKGLHQIKNMNLIGHWPQICGPTMADGSNPWQCATCVVLLYHLHPHLEQKIFSIILEDTHVWLLSFNIHHAFLKWGLMDMVAPRVPSFIAILCLISCDLFTKTTLDHKFIIEINLLMKCGVLVGLRSVVDPEIVPVQMLSRLFKDLQHWSNGM